MKKLILAAITLTTAVSVFAQGTVVFANRSAGGTTHLWWTPNIHTAIQGNGPGDSPPGTTDYSSGILVGTSGSISGPTTFAQLLAAPGANQPESSLLPAAGIVTFRTGGPAGLSSTVIATANNVPQDAPVATFQMVAWDNSSGLYPTWAEASVAWIPADLMHPSLILAGRSAPFNIYNIGGTTFTPPNIIPGLTSFNIWAVVPEPTTAALAGLGAAILCCGRRKQAKTSLRTP